MRPRSTRPSRFFRAAWLDALLCAAMFVLPFLTPGNEILSHSALLGTDRAEYHLAYMQFEYDYLRRGVIPFWNPYVFGGMPEFANPERGPMYPVHFVAMMLWGPAAMLKIKFLFHIGLAGLGCFLLLRALAVRTWLALLGALTLEASGWPITKIAVPNVGDSAAWIPLMLFLSLWFLRRPTLGRGLTYALLGGFMLNLFFPQITLPLIGICALLSAAHFVKVRGAARPAPQAVKWIDRLFLPVAELVLMLTLLRYPKNAVLFPAEGWRCAFNCLGATGKCALVLIPALWIAWLVLRGVRVRVEWRRLGRWGGRFAGVWALAASLAAPQLAITAEFIPLSNQQALRYEPDDFFTGVQAYGCIQDFVIKSGLALQKESINNMAVGPAVYPLVLVGILLGFHRRRRWFLFLLAGAVVVGLVYFAAPGVFEVWIRLPFFGKFAGFSRYLGFLNVFVIVLAIVSAEMCLKRLSRIPHSAFRVPHSVAAWGVAAALIVNLGFLANHQWGYWRRVRENPSPTVPREVAGMVGRHLSEDERLVVDARNRPKDFVPLLMLGVKYRFPVLASYTPMRLLAYDGWMQAHNDSLGASYGDYRASLWEPTPSPWTRAMRVRGFLMAPGATPGLGWNVAGDWPRLFDELDGWRLMGDREILPCAWPEKNLDRNPPVPEIPEAWRAEIVASDLHRIELRVFNPFEEATWMVVAMPRYPGWRARVLREEGGPGESGSGVAPASHGQDAHATANQGPNAHATTVPPMLPAPLAVANAILAREEAADPRSNDDGSTRTALAYGFLEAVPVPAGASTVYLEYCPGSFALGWLFFLWGVWVWAALACSVSRIGSIGSTENRAFPPGYRKAFTGLCIGGAIPAALIATRVWESCPDALLVRMGEFALIGLLAFAAAVLTRRACRPD